MSLVFHSARRKLYLAWSKIGNRSTRKPNLGSLQYTSKEIRTGKNIHHTLINFGDWRRTVPVMSSNVKCELEKIISQRNLFNVFRVFKNKISMFPADGYVLWFIVILKMEKIAFTDLFTIIFKPPILALLIFWYID